VRLEPDPQAVGTMVTKIWSRAILNALAARAEEPAVDKAVVDLPHREMVRDPAAAIRRLYQHFGEPFSDEFGRRIDHFIGTHENASRLGKHRHSAEEYGIDPAKVRRVLAPYYDRFGDLLTPEAAPRH
jgi:23S rRNA G2445 N2-methylase RlmL